MSKATNKCLWLKVNSYICNKNCVNTYCRQHTQQINLGKLPPRPCRKCNKGVSSNNTLLLCKDCGRNKIIVKQQRIEKKARKNFNKVLQELIEIKAY